MSYYQDDAITLHLGKNLDVLPTLADGSVDCCVTSPPYFALRDYGHPDQIGAEKSPAEFVEALRAVFAEVRRVLADDGTLWLNCGDSYVGGGGYSPNAPSNIAGSKSSTSGGLISGGIKASRVGVAPKNLLGIPWRVAFALQDDDSGDVYELNADAPDDIRSAVYLETCRTKIPTQPANTAANTPSGGEKPTLSDTQSEWPNGTQPTKTSSGDTAESTTNSTASKRSSVRSRETESATADSDSLRYSTTGARTRSAPVAESGTYPSLPSTTSTEAATSIGRNSAPKTSASLNTSAKRDTRLATESSAITATTREGSTGRARTKTNARLRKAQIQPDWLPYFRLVKQERWILRNAVVWNKPNAMPESVTDRLSTRYEMLFMFSKSRKYWFDLDAIREAHDFPGKTRTLGRAGREGAASKRSAAELAMQVDGHLLGKNPGDCWDIPTTPFPGAHFAVFPPELPRRCIVAGCKPGGTVLDPFHGSGTTGMVATRNGRKYVGIELNEEYLDLSLRTRLSDGVLDFDGGAA